MSVLSKLIVTEKQEAVKFPKLYQHNKRGFVVLFTKPTYGIVVNPNDVDAYRVGTRFDCWIDCTDTKEWKEYDGVVELKNE